MLGTHRAWDSSASRAESTLTIDKKMKETNKPNLKQIIVIGIFVGLGSVGGKFAYNYFTTGSIADQTKIERSLMQVANEMNQNLPLVLDLSYSDTPMPMELAGNFRQSL